MFRVASTAVLAALVVLAGCGSLATPADEGTPTRTVTPAPLPPEVRTPQEPGVLAPGVSPDGVFDAGRLAEAHATVLSNTSFTTVREERRRYANGSLRSAYRRVVRVSTGGERFDYDLNQTDVRGGRTAETRLARYSNGSVVYAATTRDGTTTYSTLDGPSGPAGPSVLPARATARSGLARLFGTLRFDVVDRRAVDGRAVYHLVVENGSQRVGSLRNVSMNASVREDGLVIAYRLTYDVGGLRVSVNVTFRDVGETEVASPAWLPAARNATGTGVGSPGADTSTPTPTATPAGRA
ncbi:hypothetical protein ACFQE8_06385 [Salinirubellus sp. GCM10025818]|uniref:hypothetical protein n=1 Tax=Salinirubellus TaxID=2162630 RepID=UPI0030CCB1A4